MVLFMEGGCDYGDSNIFFFAKASLLLTVNLALLGAWRRNPESWRGFLPHLALLALLSYANRSGGHCDSYYAHPNGSLGQMILELGCFAVAALGAGRTPWRWGGSMLAMAGLLWNVGSHSPILVSRLLADETGAPLTRRQTLSLFFIAAVFGLLSNRNGLTLVRRRPSSSTAGSRVGRPAFAGLPRS